MSYRTGKMGVAEGMALVFSTSITSVFYSMWSVYLDHVANSAWLIPLISAGCFLAVFMLLLFVMERVPGDLYAVSETLLGRSGAWAVSAYLIAVFYADAVFTLRQFAENTLLTAIPELNISMIMGSYVLMAAFVIYIGLEPIARGALLVLPFGIVALTLVIILSGNKFHLYFLWPWIGNGITALLKTGVPATGSFIYALILPIFAPAFQNIRTIRTATLFGIGLSTAFRTLIFFMYTGVFSTAAGRELVLPFYNLARIIYLNRFVQRVEAFFIILWAIFGLALIAINLYVALYLLTRLLDLPSMRPLILPMALVAVQLALLPPDIATVIEMYHNYTAYIVAPGVFAIPMVLFIATLVKGRAKNKPCTAK